jgi:protein MpaA
MTVLVRVARAAAATTAVALVANGGVTASAHWSTPGGGNAVDRPAVTESRVIGRSVEGRAIRAYRVGDSRARRTVVVLAAMHGNELAPRLIVRDVRDGAPVRGVDLWLVPTYNPDGAADRTRQNARGVDLNRNFPVRWRDLDGAYESGSGPGSEPETRAVKRFLTEVDPDRIVSFHQPLYGVDVRGKAPAFGRRLADALRLPVRAFDCGGVCHGTLTQWFNARHDGVAITVELGESPTRRYLHRVAPRGLLRAIGGAR